MTRRYDNLGAWNYDELIQELWDLGDAILTWRDMSPDEERSFRVSYDLGSSDYRIHSPEEAWNLRTSLIVEDGQRQASIVRECLRRGT
jgi:hypothetical protein